MDHNIPVWLRRAREIQALARTGLHYAQNDYERARANRLLEIAAEIVADYSDAEVSDLLVAFKRQPGYVTPKVDVRGAVFKGGKILLVKEVVDDAWTMPGGWADVGETPKQAVQREVFEESGISVRAHRLVGVYDVNREAGAWELFHAYKLVFLCEPIRGTPTPSSETSAVSFFSPDEMPTGFSTPRTTPRHIFDAFAVFEDLDRSVVFD
jgi:ADP-ribose pyrophosphatase YjhB (NUDIX family)